MKRISTCTLGMTGLLVLWLLVGAAWPAPSGANGLNLSWDACGHAGASNKAFACNTNVGEEKLVLSGIFPVASLLPEIRYIADLDFASGENVGFRGGHGLSAQRGEHEPVACRE